MRRCQQQIVVHRFRNLDTRTFRPRVEKAYECPDPDCDGDRQCHEAELPCRWTWMVAHGKSFNGEVFPKIKCPACKWVPRPAVPMVDTQTG